MEQNLARQIISDWTKKHYGQFVEVREVSTLRKATGRIWSGDLYCVIRDGDVHVGNVTVDESGEIIKTVTIDEIIDILINVKRSNIEAASNAENPFAPQISNAEHYNDESEDEFAALAPEEKSSTTEAEDDFSSLYEDPMGLAEIDSLEETFNLLDPTSLQEMVNSLIANGQRDKLLEARTLLPQLLAQPDTRGSVLQQMGELELLLGELDLGVRYLEDSSSEYYNIANFEALNIVASLIYQVIGDVGFENSKAKSLNDNAHARMQPIQSLEDAPLLIGLSKDDLSNIVNISQDIVLENTDILLKEGDLASKAFIVKSGVLSIRLEMPDGGSRVIRSCFPGEFIGESSILGFLNNCSGDDAATCSTTYSATVRSESHAELWQFEGIRLGKLCQACPDVLIRIESVKTLHQLDSFLSMHEAAQTLDVSVRDQLLSSITGIRNIKMNTVLNQSGKVPSAVHLVVNGTVEFRVNGKNTRSYTQDNFAGLRDTLHKLPLKGEFVAATDCLLVFFDSAMLQSISEKANPEVIAVLEKLE